MLHRACVPIKNLNISGAGRYRNLTAVVPPLLNRLKEVAVTVNIKLIIINRNLAIFV